MMATDSLTLYAKFRHALGIRPSAEGKLSPLYTTLDQTRNEIRLLRFLPHRTEQEATRCQLLSYSLNDNPVYLALSYVWGDPSVMEDIVINGHSKSVTTNLSSSLKRLRRAVLSQPMPWSTRSQLPNLLWVDTICINQDDITERNSQVQLMGSIYKKADCVISWMGPEKESTKLAIKHIKLMCEVLYKHLRLHRDSDHISWIQKFPELYEANALDFTCNRTWNAIHDFLRNPYWSRIWILQEMALAKHVMLVCGNADMLFSHLDYIRKWTDELRSWKIDKPEFIPLVLWSQIVATGNFNWRPVSFVSELRSARSQSGKVNKLGNYAMIYNTYHHAAAEPRDKVYGILSLLNTDILPDYSKSVAEIYCEYIRKLYDEVRDVEFLCGAGIGSDPYRGFDLPTWAPNWHKIGTEKFSTFLPDGIYNANKGMIELLPGDAKFTIPSTLTVLGASIGTICIVDPEFNRDSLLRLCSTCVALESDAGNPQSTTLQSRLEIAFRTAMMDLDPRTSMRLPHDLRANQTQEIARSFIRVLTKPQHSYSNPSGHDSTDTILRQANELENVLQRFLLVNGITVRTHSPNEHALDTNVRMHLNRCSKMRIFHTENGYLGLGLQGVAPGDVVCVLNRCRVPVVLRPAESHYFLVSECLIVSLMDGECVQQINEDNDSFKSRYFDIY